MVYLSNHSVCRNLTEQQILHMHAGTFPSNIASNISHDQLLRATSRNQISHSVYARSWEVIAPHRRCFIMHHASKLDFHRITNFCILAPCMCSLIRSTRERISAYCDWRCLQELSKFRENVEGSIGNCIIIHSFLTLFLKIPGS